MEQYTSIEAIRQRLSKFQDPNEQDLFDCIQAIKSIIPPTCSVRRTVELLYLLFFDSEPQPPRKKQIDSVQVFNNPVRQINSRAPNQYSQLLDQNLHDFSKQELSNDMQQLQSPFYPEKNKPQYIGTKTKQKNKTRIMPKKKVKLDQEDPDSDQNLSAISTMPRKKRFSRRIEKVESLLIEYMRVKSWNLDEYENRKTIMRLFIEGVTNSKMLSNIVQHIKPEDCYRIMQNMVKMAYRCLEVFVITQKMVQMFEPICKEVLILLATHLIHCETTLSAQNRSTFYKFIRFLFSEDSSITGSKQLQSQADRSQSKSAKINENCQTEAKWQRTSQFPNAKRHQTEIINLFTAICQILLKMHAQIEQKQKKNQNVMKCQMQLKQIKRQIFRCQYKLSHKGKKVDGEEVKTEFQNKDDDQILEENAELERYIVEESHPLKRRSR